MHLSTSSPKLLDSTFSSASAEWDLNPITGSSRRLNKRNFVCTEKHLADFWLHTVWTSVPYFLWCCFCRAASDNCPWRISFLCLSISPSIRAKAWEPMKDRSTPKPSSSSSSWFSAMKVPSAENYGSRPQNRQGVLWEQQLWGDKTKPKSLEPGLRWWFWNNI